MGWNGTSFNSEADWAAAFSQNGGFATHSEAPTNPTQAYYAAYHKQNPTWFKKPNYTIPPPPSAEDLGSPQWQQLLQYLTPDERSRFQNETAFRQAAQAQAKQQYSDLQNLVGLAKNRTAQGVKFLQSALKQKGYNIAVDANYGPQTQSALSDYVNKVGPDLQRQINSSPATEAYKNIYTSGENAIKGQADEARKQIVDKIDVMRHQLVAEVNKAYQGYGGIEGPNARFAPDEVKKQATDAQKQLDTLSQLRARVLDPINGADNHTALTILQNFQQAEADAAAKAAKSKKGGGGFGLHSLVDAGKWLVEHGVDDILYRPAMAVLAGERAQLQQGSASPLTFLKGLQASVGSFTSFIRIPGTNASLVGLIAPGGSDARKAIEATNSMAEREKLAQEGQLLSPGQLLTNTTTPQFQANHPNFGDYGGIKMRVSNSAHGDIISGLGDLAFTMATDPLAEVGKLLSPFRAPVEAAAEAGLRAAPRETIDAVGETVAKQQFRAGYLAYNPTGRAIIDKAGEALGDLTLTADTKGLLRALPGLPASVAEEAIAARAAAEGGAGVEAAQAVIKKAIIEGKWNPEVGIARQSLNLVSSKVSEGGLGLVGRKAVVLTDRLAWLRRVGNAVHTAAVFGGDPAGFLSRSVEVGSRIANKTWRHVWADEVAHEVAGLGLQERFWRVADYAESNPEFARVFEANAAPYFNAASKNLRNIPLVTYMEDVWHAQPADFENMLRQSEVAMAIHTGSLGTAAAEQIQRDMVRGFLVTEAERDAVAKTAANNLGLQLGNSIKGATEEQVRASIGKLNNDALETFFTNRLQRFVERGRNLGGLARDIRALSASKALRDEVQRLVERMDGLSERALDETATKPGLAKQVLAKGARGVLDLAEYSAPRDISFKVGPNPELHAELRVEAIDRVAGGYQIAEAARTALRVQAMNVRTEEDLFKLAHDVVRAGIERYGIDDPQAMMKLLEERGDFKVMGRDNSIVRTFDPITGEPVSDLQTLAQRIESVRVPAPDELAGNIKKAILDGAVDSEQISKLNAGLRVWADKAGNIHIFGIAPDGIRVAARKAHQWWKFLVVTNSAMPIIGATAGFLGTHGNLGDRLKGAGLGFAVGSAFSARYLFRVVGLEDRIRMFVADGFLPEAWVPGYGKFQARRYLQDVYRRFMSEDLIRVGNFGASHFENDFLVHVDPEWGIIARDESRAPDAWWRIVNHQIHPESDPVMAILLREKAGQLGGVEERVLAAEKTANEKLLAEHPDAAGTKIFYRGEGGQFANRGNWWVPADYEGGRGLEYAQRIAGEDAHIYQLELPVDAEGKPLVGMAPSGPEGNIGWFLAGPYQKWADAATELGAEAPGPRKLLVNVGRNEADKAIKEFLGTEEGRIWQDRWKGAYGGTGSSAKAVARMREFVDRYMDEELASMRVGGDINGKPALIERDTLKRKLKEGLGPDSFHAQKSWRIPRNAKDLFRAWRANVQENVLEKPTLAINRRPSANGYFMREYDRLVANGVDHAEAQQIADAAAVRRSNSFMHKLGTQTRFAQKTDFWLPFQHAREDIVKSWTKLAIAHPGNTVRLVTGAARLFNNGAAQGIFVKNDFTGKWELAVPGAPQIANKLFGVPFQVGFAGPVQDMLFIGTGAFNVGFLPQPGGPFWSVISRGLATVDPSLFEGKNPIQQWLWNYGPGGNLLRNDTSRLWMAMTGDTPPWEFANQAQWKDQLRRWSREVGEELIYQNRIKGGDPNYVPSDEEVADATKKFFRAWAFFGTTVPTSTQPTFTSEEKFRSAYSAFTLGGVYGDDSHPGIIPFDSQEFLKQYPEFEAHLSGPTTKYVGPDDVATIKRLNVGHYDPDAPEAYMQEESVGYRQHLSWAEWRDQFKLYKRTSDYYTELDNARQMPNLVDREYAISEVNKKYADVVGKQNRDYQIEKELTNIADIYPKGQMRDDALKRVKATYGLSNVDVFKYQARLDRMREKGKPFLANPWKEARLGFEVDQAVKKDLGSNANDRKSVEAYVSKLNPAEQANFWHYQAAAMGYDPELDLAGKVLDKYDYFMRQYFQVGDAYPFLYRQKGDDNPFQVLLSKTKADIRDQTDASYKYIDQLSASMSSAARAKNWKAYYAMKAQREKAYTYVNTLRDQIFQKIPDLTQYYDDLHAMHLYEDAGNETEAHRMQVKALMDSQNAPFVRTTEETRFLDMPDPVKRAYMQDLVDGLDMPAGKSPYDVSQYVKNTTGLHKLFWEYLTPLQQQVLEQNLPQYQVQNYKDASNYYLHGDGAKQSSGGGRGRGSNIPGELAFAYQMLKQYNQRGGAKPPAAYADYIKLPKNPAVKAQFLKDHPDVADYIRKGPLANMPPLYRELTIAAMVKYGKWQNEGGVPDVNEITDIAFAQQQMQMWNKRPQGALAPSTYNDWLNMPSGAEKAAYLRAHPEVQRWIQMGPMANMPDAYKQVVRDIMYRYGQWTQQQDPLGATITQYYQTPGYARDQFLQDHPELEIYWSLARTPDENAMFDLQNTYFGIQDVGARRAFLAAHPELQQHFIDARDKRYNNFLNQVATYMGANPEMFQQYLQRQDDILAELLHRFAEPVMVREAAPQTVATQGVKEGSRNRQRTLVRRV